MAQVVEGDVDADFGSGAYEGLIDGVASGPLPVTTDGEEFRAGEAFEMRLEDWQDVGWGGHCALAGGTLGVLLETHRRLEEFDPVLRDTNAMFFEVDVDGADRAHLSTTQTAPGSEDDSSPIARSDGFHEFRDLARGSDTSLGRLLGPGTWDLTGVAGMAPSLRATFITDRSSR